MYIDKNLFWNWAHSNFLSNAYRGVLAEYIVGKALECLPEKRTEWDAYDLLTKDGLKIEIKSSAYVQSWEQSKPSAIRFDIAEKQSWDAQTNTYSESATRSADIYVFCVLAEKDKNKANPLDLDQWFFMVIPTYVLNDQVSKQKSVGLSTLERIGGIKLKHPDLEKTS